jgi:2-polyprenyl-6-methoxyphenol hydroxylase-like FAD-dependent oxidoreductase
LEAYCASRGLIEFVLRKRTTAVRNIGFASGSAVRDLIHRDGAVRGVRCADARVIEADLVVDATGRGHRARQWLTSAGFSPPDETEIGLDTAYSTANFRKPESFPGEPIIFITGPAPHFTRRGYVITIENGTLLVSLIGRFGDFPRPTSKDFWPSPRSFIRTWRIASSRRVSSSPRSRTIDLSAACNVTTSDCSVFQKVLW